MHFYRILLLIFSVTLILGCQERKKTASKKKDKPDELDQALELDQKRVQLSPKATDSLNNWAEFLNAKAEINKLPGMSYQEVIDNSNTLKEAVQRMADSIPKNFQNKAISGRINVLKTETVIFNQNVENNNYSKEVVARSAAEIYAGFRNLEIQLNEVFLTPLKDIEEEMRAAVKDTVDKPTTEKP